MFPRRPPMGYFFKDTLQMVSQKRRGKYRSCKPAVEYGNMKVPVPVCCWWWPGRRLSAYRLVGCRPSSAYSSRRKCCNNWSQTSASPVDTSLPLSHLITATHTACPNITCHNTGHIGQNSVMMQRRTACCKTPTPSHFQLVKYDPPPL